LCVAARFLSSGDDSCKPCCLRQHSTLSNTHTRAEPRRREHQARGCQSPCTRTLSSSDMPRRTTRRSRTTGATSLTTTPCRCAHPTHTYLAAPCTVPWVPPRANEAPHCFTLACAARPTCTARPNLCAASLTCAASMQPDLTRQAITSVLQPSTQPRTQINDMPHAFSNRGTPYAASCASAKPASLWSATRTTHPQPLTS
jgi:hypothetical protein